MINPTPPKKRILVLTSTFPRWGGDSEPPFVLELSRRLATNFDVTVLCPHTRGAPSFERMCGIDIFRFRYCPSSLETLAYQGGILGNLRRNVLNYLLLPPFMLAQLISCVRLLRRYEIAAIHAHWMIPQGVIALVSRFFTASKPPIICTSHGGDLFGLRNTPLKSVNRWVIGRVQKMVVVSDAMRQYAGTISGRVDIEVLSMGVDLSGTFSPCPHTIREPFTVLFIGRLVEKKGGRYAILAMKEVLADYPQAVLKIIGSGPEREKLESLVESLELKGHVLFLGPVPNEELVHHYRSATIFIVPSIIAASGDQEGLCLVPIEALGCGCPVIASDLGGIRDVIIDGVTGLLCKPRSPNDLAQKIKYLLQDRAGAAKLAEAGREHVASRFDWERVASGYQQLIEEAINISAGASELRQASALGS